MAHITVTIDNQTVMDADLGQWSAEPPELEDFKKRATSQREPWMIAILHIVAATALSGVDHDVTVTTTPSEWTMNVQQHPQPDTAP